MHTFGRHDQRRHLMEVVDGFVARGAIRYDDVRSGAPNRDGDVPVSFLLEGKVVATGLHPVRPVELSPEGRRLS